METKRLIDANKLLERENEAYLVARKHPSGAAMFAIVHRTLQELLRQAPIVDAVEVVHGRWREKILVGGFAEEWGYVCSECGCTVSDRSKLGICRYVSNNQRLNYCPNCGAKMDGDGNG